MLGLVVGVADAGPKGACLDVVLDQACPWRSHGTRLKEQRLCDGHGTPAIDRGAPDANPAVQGWWRVLGGAVDEVRGW